MADDKIKTGKQLSFGSSLDSADINNDGIITDEELQRQQQFLEIEDQNAMRDAQRNMAWFALSGMLLYPFSVVLSEILGLKQAGNILGDMAPTYFVSVAAIVAAFYGKSAFENKSAPTSKPTSATKLPEGANRVPGGSKPL